VGKFLYPRPTRRLKKRFNPGGTRFPSPFPACPAFIPLNGSQSKSRKSGLGQQVLDHNKNQIKDEAFAEPKKSGGISITAFIFFTS
jgi:hypothetical protein